MDKNFWREYFSIPNIMGYFRIALAMLYMLLFYRALDGAPYWTVIVTIVISGITDFFDGKIARRFNMITDWGKMLDPIADKITLGAIIISMSFKYSIVVPMVVFYIIKECYMAVAGIKSIRAGHKIEGAMCFSFISLYAGSYGLCFGYSRYDYNGIYPDKIFYLSQRLVGRVKR